MARRLPGSVVDRRRLGLDLFLGRRTRDHADVDVALMRGDQSVLFRYLRGWELRHVDRSGELVPWNGSVLELPVHEIRARPPAPASAAAACEFLLNEERTAAGCFAEIPP